MEKSFNEALQQVRGERQDLHTTVLPAQSKPMKKSERVRLLPPRHNFSK